MDNVLIKLITDAGWKSVNERPPKGSVVEILILWGSDSVSLIQGTAEYKNGSYYSGEQLLDTPSFWREVGYVDTLESLRAQLKAAQQSPAVAVPDEDRFLQALGRVMCSECSDDGPCCMQDIRDLRRIISVQSPRITEQDAREIIDD